MKLRRGAGSLARAAVVLAVTLAGVREQSRPDADLAMNKGAPLPPARARDFSVNAGDLVYFSTDSVDLSQEAQQTLANQARWLRQYAHTPSRSKAMPTSAAPANTTSRSAPSAPRRCAISWSSNGINAARIRTVSFGKERPVAVCNDISCWSQNRRAQTVLGGRQDL